MIRILTPQKEYVCEVDTQGQAERVIERYIRQKRKGGETYNYGIKDFYQVGIEEDTPLEYSLNRNRYCVNYYYTHIKTDGLHTQQVKRFSVGCETVKEALKKARKPADANKGVFMTIVVDEYTGNIVYQKIEICNNGDGMWWYD